MEGRKCFVSRPVGDVPFFASCRYSGVKPILARNAASDADCTFLKMESDSHGTLFLNCCFCCCWLQGILLCDSSQCEAMETMEAGGEIVASLESCLPDNDNYTATPLEIGEV
jgi:hypothetical protein